MKEEQTLKKVLYEGTLLIKKVESGELSIHDFIEQYNNFYYYNALDGHEANESTKKLLHKYSKVIELHKKVQKDVVDLIFIDYGDDANQYLEAGRIPEEEASKRIANFVDSFQVMAILPSLTD